MEKLTKVLDGFAEVGGQPIFILMGNFLSQPALGAKGKQAAISAFSALADAISKYPHLNNKAKFVLVSGLIMIIFLNRTHVYYDRPSRSW